MPRRPAGTRFRCDNGWKSGGRGHSGVQKCQRPRRETSERIKSARTSGALNFSRFFSWSSRQWSGSCNIADRSEIGTQPAFRKGLQGKREMAKKSGQIQIGIGGGPFAPWRGVFYPEKLTQAKELSYAASKLTSIEINGT